MRNIRAVLCFFGFLASLCFTQSSAVAQGMEVQRLTPGIPVAQTFSNNKPQHYQFALSLGQRVNIQVVKQGISLHSILKNPAGKELFTADFEVREHGAETILLIAQTTGIHTVTVKPAYGVPQSNRYEIKIDEPRAATEAEQQLFAAQLLFVEAGRLFYEETEKSRRTAILKLTEALTVWRAAGRQDWEARTLFQMGWYQFWLGEYDAALSTTNQALELRRASHDRLGEAEALSSLGAIYLQQEKHQQALTHLKEALVLQQATGERQHTADTFLQLAKIYGTLFDHENMMYHYKEALEGFRRVGDQTNEAVTLVDLAAKHREQGDYQMALDYAQRSLTLYRAEKVRYGEGVALHHLGAVYYNLGDQEKALQYYQQSLPIFRATDDLYAAGYVLTSIGVSYNLMGEQSKALAHLTQALTLRRKVQDQRGEAGTLRFMGKTYWDLGNAAKALAHLNQALAIAKTLNDLATQTDILTFIGEIYAGQKNDEEALKYLEMALPMARAVNRPKGEANILLAIAQVERKRGNLSAAQQNVEEAIRIIESVRARVVGVELRRTYLAAQQGSYEFYMDLLMQLHEQSPNAGYDARALQISERARARALLDSLVEARADIRQGGDPALLERERLLQKQLDEREIRRIRIFSGKHTPEQLTAADREVENTLTELQQAQTQIRATSPRYAALTQPQPLELKQMQAQLDAETLLLVYSLGTNRSFLWAVTPTTVKSYVLPARAKIEHEANRFYQLLQASHQRASRGSAELAAQESFRLLLGPVAKQLTNQRLVIVADGALQYLPFAALRESVVGGRWSVVGGKASQPPATSHQPLHVQHEIIYLPSVSALNQLRQDVIERKPAPKTMVAIADPVFEVTDMRFNAQPKRAAVAVQERSNLLITVQRSARDIGLTSFPRLQASGQEAEQITRLVPPALSTQLVGFDASRAKLAQIDLSQYRMLHFATHSFLNPKNPELSGIVLSLYDRQQQPQDGFLRTHEIYNLKLNADLVTLSACQTALGKEVRGEGLLGLSRGFMYAGAPRLVVSLWKVNDQATAELMQKFYQAMLRDNLRPAAALRAAQISMAQDARWVAPYFWAGFVLQGEWR